MLQTVKSLVKLVFDNERPVIENKRKGISIVENSLRKGSRKKYKRKEKVNPKETLILNLSPSVTLGKTEQIRKNVCCRETPKSVSKREKWLVVVLFIWEFWQSLCPVKTSGSGLPGSVYRFGPGIVCITHRHPRTEVVVPVDWRKVYRRHPSLV